VKYARVPKASAEEARRRLHSEGVLDRSAAALREGEDVLFPVVRDPEGYETVEREARKRKARPRTLKEALKGLLSDAELVLVNSSYSVVGDIAVVELDPGLLSKGEAIGDAMLATFPNIRVAAAKTEQVSGEYRVPGITILAGENRTETTHREHGCAYRLDIAEAYFSPRLGSERLRVAEQVKDGERVLVLFAGVGPYPILIAKKAKAEVTAVELNPKAAEYLRWNVKRNKAKVEAVEGDARAVLPALGMFDRIVMPLPKQADTFLDAALPHLGPGGVVHYYTFARNTLEASGYLAETMAGLGRRIRILAAVPCGSYSPRIDRICVDFAVQ
jgi:tRNA (guanine37-N1)-methyltransferase